MKELGFTFITNKEFLSRDGLIPVGTLAEINEISLCEFNGEGILEPYKVIFSYEVELFDNEITNATDWLTEDQLEKII